MEASEKEACQEACLGKRNKAMKSANHDSHAKEQSLRLNKKECGMRSSSSPVRLRQAFHIVAICGSNLLIGRT